MDIWAWVHEAEEDLRRDGHQRLAEIVEGLPRLVVDGFHEQVEAILPEGLALARAIDHSWLEVFLRHWLAQSRILHRCDVTHGMDEVVRLLDFAHGERTANCPQSVCVTQDFCNAYDKLDGPGFAVERVAVSSEALARIDPSWPCFNCISAEHTEALIDLGRYADAEAFIRRQRTAIGRNDDEPSSLILQLTDVLSHLGRNEEAVELLDALDTSQEQKSRRIEHAQQKTRQYALMGRIAEAIALHPAAADLQPSDYVTWLRSEQVLCAAIPERNDAKLGRTLRGFCNTLRTNGSLYQQAEIAIGAAKFALARGRARVAALHLEQVAGLLPMLRRPEKIALARAELEAQWQPPMSDVADEATLLAHLGDDAEGNYEALLPAHAANPASEPLTLALCRALQEMGFPENARQVLEAFVQAQPESGDIFYELMRLLARTGAEQRLRELAESVPGPMRAAAHFYLGRMLVRREDWSGASQAFERAREFESDPNRSTMSNLATAYRNLGRNEDALALLDELATSETDFSDDWDRMYVATLLGQHDKVRDSARRLGFKFEGEGPIDDPFEYCEVKLRDGVGREIGIRAIRINPVVVRITAMQAPDQPCRYRDEVLIDPYVLNPRESEAPAEGNDDYLPAFRGERLLKAGGYRIYDLDGVHPGEAEVDALGKALIAREIHMSQRSGDGYQLTPREGEPTVRGIYIFIAVPQSVSTVAVREILASALGEWKVPITWRGVLRELGNETELARHEGIAQELKL